MTKFELINLSPMSSNSDPASKPLPPQAIGELTKVATWLQSGKAEFQHVDNVNICNNKAGLTKVATNLIKEFATEITVWQTWALGVVYWHCHGTNLALASIIAKSRYRYSF